LTRYLLARIVVTLVGVAVWGPRPAVRTATQFALAASGILAVALMLLRFVMPRRFGFRATDRR
jgi:hypothetical protein